MLACKLNRIAVAKYAIARCGADPNYTTGFNQTPLILAIEKSKEDSHLQLIKYLLAMTDLSKIKVQDDLRVAVNQDKYKLSQGSNIQTIIHAALSSAIKSEKMQAASSLAACVPSSGGAGRPVDCDDDSKSQFTYLQWRRARRKSADDSPVSGKSRDESAAHVKEHESRKHSLAASESRVMLQEIKKEHDLKRTTEQFERDKLESFGAKELELVALERRLKQKEVQLQRREASLAQRVELFNREKTMQARATEQFRSRVKIKLHSKSHLTHVQRLGSKVEVAAAARGNRFTDRLSVHRAAAGGGNQFAALSGQLSP